MISASSELLLLWRRSLEQIKNVSASPPSFPKSSNRIQNPENKLICFKVQTRTSSFLILSFDVNKRVKVCVRDFNVFHCSPWRPAEPHQKVWPLKQNSFALWRGQMTRCTSCFLFYLNSAIISHLFGQIIFLRWRCTLPQDVNPEVQNHPVWT